MSQNGGTTTPPEPEEGAAQPPTLPTLPQDSQAAPQSDQSPSPATSQTAPEDPGLEPEVPDQQPQEAIKNMDQLPTPAATQVTNGTSQTANEHKPPENRREDQETNEMNGTHDDEEPTPDPQVGSSKEALEEYSWSDLEERFAAKMRECEAKEEELGREFREWVEVCSCLARSSWLAFRDLLLY